MTILDTIETSPGLFIPYDTADHLTPLLPADVANAIRAKTTAEIAAQREGWGPSRVVDVDDPVWLARAMWDWDWGVLL